MGLLLDEHSDPVVLVWNLVTKVWGVDRSAGKSIDHMDGLLVIIKCNRGADGYHRYGWEEDGRSA